MSKSLTKLQEKMIGLALVGSSLHPQRGEVRSFKDLRSKGMVKQGAYTMHPDNLTDVARRTFFADNKPVFALDVGHFTGVAVFDHGHHIATCKTKEQADRVVRGLRAISA